MNEKADESNTEITGNICDLDKSNDLFVTTELFNSFYEQYLEFKYIVTDKLENYKETENEKLNLQNKVRLLENEILHLKDVNKELKEDTKNHLKIIKTLSEEQIIDAPWQTVCSKKFFARAAKQYKFI